MTNIKTLIFSSLKRDILEKGAAQEPSTMYTSLSMKLLRIYFYVQISKLLTKVHLLF